MARGDEIKTATKATFACKQFDVSAPAKKPAATSYQPSVKKTATAASHGAWGPVFKDRKTFTDMHLC